MQIEHRSICTSHRRIPRFLHFRSSPGFADVVIFGALQNPVKKSHCRGLLLYVWLMGILGNGGRVSHLGDRLLPSWKTIMRFPRNLNALEVPLNLPCISA